MAGLAYILILSDEAGIEDVQCKRMGQPIVQTYPHGAGNRDDEVRWTG